MLEVSLAFHSFVFHGQLEVERGRILGPVVGLLARGYLVAGGVNPRELGTGIERRDVELISVIGLSLALQDRR